MSLKAKTLRAVKWTSTASFFRVGVQVIQLAVLARILSKDDFGLFAITMVVLGFAIFFVEAGLGSAVIHRQNASREELANAYVVNIFLGWVVFAAIFLMAQPIASFYEDNRLVNLLRVASAIFLFQPWGLQYEALFQRDLKFDFLAKVDIASALVSLLSAVSLALAGFGVYSLVLSQLLNSLFKTIVLVLQGVSFFGFKLAFSWANSKYFLRFSSFQIGEKSVNYFNMQIDVILIGKLLGQEVLGVYYMAKQLVFRPIGVINPIITNIALPVFAQIQSDEARLRRGFLEVVHTLAVIHFAIYFLMAGFAKEITIIIFGSGWDDAVSLIVILSFYVLQRALGNPVGSLLLAKGKVELGFVWNLSLLFVIPPVVWYSSKWGAEGVAWGLLSAFLISQIPGWYFLVYKLCKASMREYYGKLLYLLFFSIACFGGLLLLDETLNKVLLAIAGSTIYLYANYSTIRKLRVKNSL